MRDGTGGHNILERVNISLVRAKSLASGTGSWESNELGESKIAGEL